VERTDRNELTDWLSYLMKEGCDGAVLAHLAGCQGAAEAVIDKSSTSGSYTHRKLAATLAGYLSEPRADLVARLLAQERERDTALAATSMDRLSCQSVVEDIVFSATRWC